MQKNTELYKVKSIIEGVDSYKTNYKLSSIYQSLGKYKKAVSGYMATIQQKSDHGEALCGLIYCLRKLGAVPREIKGVLNDYFSFDTEPSLYVLAKSMYKNGYYRETINITRKICMPEGKLLLAKSLININLYKEARDILKEVSPKYKIYQESLYELALICILTQKNEQCHTILKKITLLGGDKRLYIYGLFADYHMEDFKLHELAALEVFHRILETNNLVLMGKVETIMDKYEELAPYYIKLGKKYEESDQWFLAINNYKKGLQKGYVDFYSAMALGEYTLEGEEYVTAENLFKKALEINPDHYMPYRKLTEIYLLKADKMLQEEELMVMDTDVLKEPEDSTRSSNNLQRRQEIANVIKLL